MTSTLPRIYINQITKLVRNVEVKTYNPRPGDGFYDVEISKKFIASDGGLVEVKDITDIIELLEKQESSGSRSCLIVNTVRRAIDAYEELGSKALLLHSRYTVRDRKMKIESLELKDRVVSTQVIEAGVDTSFDVMVTELAPISSVIQRLGRLARKPGDEEGIWCIFFDEESLKGNGIYDEVMVKETLKVLNEVADKRINWHLPTIIGGKYLGYKDILEYVWSRYIERVGKDKVTLTIDPSIKEILTNPLIDPKQVLKYLIDIRSFVREDVMGPIYVGEPPNDYVSYINTIQDHLIPTNLDYAFRYVCKALEGGYDVAKIVRLGRDGVGTDSFRCDEKIDDLLKDIITGRLLAFLIPKELYDGGEGGVGLKPIRR
ncbi:MAG: CRISPR-associated helicase Cas3' [Thermoprotei archaeon]|nr:MAG: CRISPR-associated helicase Cas3' [Thermoprotei archaeon]